MEADLSDYATPPRHLALMVLAVVATLVLAVALIRWDPGAGSSSGRVTDATAARPEPRASASARAGAVVTLRSGEREIVRHLPAPRFALAAGESLDRRIAADGLEATIEVTLTPGKSVDQAWIGADLRGASLIVRRGEQVLLSDTAGDEPRRVMTSLPVMLGGQPLPLTFEFRRRGGEATALRALWRPIGASVPLALPCEDVPVAADDVVRGFVIAQRAACGQCHESGDESTRRSLAAAPGPYLGDAGARLRPRWLRRWLSDPTAVKPTTRMPHLLEDLDGAEGAVEDLTHFLVALGGPLPSDGTAPPDEALVATGMLAYHTVGCFACHGPLEPLEALPGLMGESAHAWRSYVPLGAPATKTSEAALAALLLDPLAHRPAGLMPAMKLTPIEAQAIAAYLMTRDEAPPAAPFSLQPDRVQRGRVHFSVFGCVNCHEVGDDAGITERRRAPPLESVVNGPRDKGCLAPAPRPGLPRYSLSDEQRDDLDAALDALAEAVAPAPLDDLAVAISRLDCTACHVYHADGPEYAVAMYFSTKGEADLGDEGRLPPPLTDAGARLTEAWMHDVLSEGGEARPYMAARMPQFGAAQVDGLPRLLAAAGGATALLDAEPAATNEDARRGRELVGADALNCIQCHVIAGHDSTGTPGPDLALMSGRLRPEYFSRWLHNPVLLNPVTRMPVFFVDGRGAFTEYDDGDADRQVTAIWRYLSQGESLPLPDGLVDPVGLELVVTDRPVVFRSFMTGAGVRAIACGYPEQVHCAFDAERCETTLIWQGRFLGAGGAWAARGGTETNPEAVVWSAPSAPLLDLSPEAGEVTRHFGGYRLDEGGAPTFLYEIRGAAGVVIEMREKPVPVVAAERRGIARRFTARGSAGAVLEIRAGEATVVRGPLEEQGGVPVIRFAGEPLEFEVEVTW